MDGDWFRFIFGSVVAMLTALSGWFTHTLFHFNDKISSLSTRVSVVENKPQVDPIDYVKAITEMSAAIAALTATIAQLRTEIQQLETLIRDQREGRAR